MRGSILVFFWGGGEVKWAVIWLNGIMMKQGGKSCCYILNGFALCAVVWPF